MIIDFHIHVFPDKIALSAIETLSTRSNIPAYTNGTIKDTLGKMKRDGVDVAVVQSIATNVKQTENVNNFAIQLNSNDNFIAFGSVHPHCDYKKELDRLADAGIKGIKLHPDYQDFYIDDPEMQPIYEYILKKGFILLFHTGLDAGLPEPVHATPERIMNIMGLISGEKVCLAHMGGFAMHEQVQDLLIGRDIYIDTSCVSEFLGVDILINLIKAHRRDRVLFATDSPWTPIDGALATINGLDIDNEYKEMILGSNAQRLLGI